METWLSNDRNAAASAHYRLFDTAFGVCAIAWTEVGLTRVLLPDQDASSIEQRVRGAAGMPWRGGLPPDIARLCAAIAGHLAGTVADYRSIKFDTRGVSEFNSRVYRHLRNVPWGQTTTYGALAAATNSPGAARAVGAAMARNPWPVIVPCHRVLASGGRIGGFSAPGGTLTKKRLLVLEGFGSDNRAQMLPGL